MPLLEKSELLDLIENPNETLDFEYKSWLDLSDSSARADLARRIAALANHGGGAIVAGFTDATPPQFAGQNPYSAVPWDRDTVAGVVKTMTSNLPSNATSSSSSLRQAIAIQ